MIRVARDIVLCTALLFAGWRAGPAAAAQPVERLGPRVDYHEHFLSPALAPILARSEGAEFSPVSLPREMADLLRRREAAWNDPVALARLYSDEIVLTQFADQNVLLFDGTIVRGRKAVSDYLATRLFGRSYGIIPIACAGKGSVRHIVAVLTRGQPRGDSANNRYLAGEQITLARQSNGRWLITAEVMKFPGPPTFKPIDAETMIKMLDEAGIERSVVLSGAYLFESPLVPETPDAADRLRAENDYTAAQVARYPTRLIGFCGVNPLTDTALAEIERCTRDLHMKGLKLHFRADGVDLSNPAHVARLGQVFAAANRLKLPIVVHVGTSPKNGRRDAEIFLDKLLPHAPDVVVQVAHMAGSGPDYSDEAMEVFARAIEAKDPRTRNLYFDVATVADLPRQAEGIARRIRQIGPQRFLYGSDAAFGGRKTPLEEWATFRGMVPLTDAEFAIIRDNVAPYLR